MLGSAESDGWQLCDSVSPAEAVAIQVTMQGGVGAVSPGTLRGRGGEAARRALLIRTPKSGLVICPGCIGC